MIVEGSCKLGCKKNAVYQSLLSAEVAKLKLLNFGAMYPWECEARGGFLVQQNSDIIKNAVFLCIWYLNMNHF